MSTIKSMSEIVESDEFAELITEIMGEKLGDYHKQENGRETGVNRCSILAYMIYHKQYYRAGLMLAELFEDDIKGLALEMYRAEKNQQDEDNDRCAAADAYNDTKWQEDIDNGR